MSAAGIVRNVHRCAAPDLLDQGPPQSHGRRGYQVLTRFVDHHHGQVTVGVPEFAPRPMVWIESTDDNSDTVTRATLCRGMAAELLDALTRFLAMPARGEHACETRRPVDEHSVRMALGAILRDIEANDTSYAARHPLVWQALALASSLGWRCGVKPDPAQLGRPVAYIDLPDFGQVSWHMPEYRGEWDGHDTPTKYERARAYADATTTRDQEAAA